MSSSIKEWTKISKIQYPVRKEINPCFIHKSLTFLNRWTKIQSLLLLLTLTFIDILEIKHTMWHNEMFIAFCYIKMNEIKIFSCSEITKEFFIRTFQRAMNCVFEMENPLNIFITLVKKLKKLFFFTLNLTTLISRWQLYSLKVS